MDIAAGGCAGDMYQFRSDIFMPWFKIRCQSTLPVPYMRDFISLAYSEILFAALPIYAHSYNLEPQQPRALHLFPIYNRNTTQ